MSFAKFKAEWYISIIEFFKEILIITLAGMLIIWPITLIIIFYKANDIGSEKLLRFICLLTIILWIAFMIYSFFSPGIEKFFYETLKTMIPKAG
jgi:cytosine/uracil/thiamine/allantoin permease